MPIDIGDSLPDITVEATSGKTVNLKACAGQITVLYFYPKDNTPGCTQEGKDFRDHYEALTKLGVTVFGVSRDTVKKHENFKAKYEFPFELLADPDEQLCEAFDVIKSKSMFGKTVLGIQRSTFVFDKAGVLQKVWRKVKVNGHVEEVLEAIKTL
jgi:peroxiredoxin Q/BCP